MDIEKERAVFEAWYIAKARKNIGPLQKWTDTEVRGGFLRVDGDGTYVGDYVAGSWDAWQARAAQDNDFPLGRPCDLSGEGSCESCQ